MRRRPRGGVFRDVLTGALAGVGAAWVMNRVTTVLYRREDPDARHREDLARAGKFSYELLVQKMGRLFGREIDDERASRLGTLVHKGMGVGAGAAYGLLRRRLGAGLGAGLIFGVGFFLIVDELANVALGLTPGPRAFPWQAHARGLAGHLVFGLAAEGELGALDRVWN